MADWRSFVTTVTPNIGTVLVGAGEWRRVCVLRGTGKTIAPWKSKKAYRGKSWRRMAAAESVGDLTSGVHRKAELIEELTSGVNRKVESIEGLISSRVHRNAESLGDSTSGAHSKAESTGDLTSGLRLRCLSHSSIPVADNDFGNGHGSQSSYAVDISAGNGRANDLVFHHPRQVGENELSGAAKLESTAHSLRPKRIILVRHGQSEGNLDESAYTRIPDSKISLTEDGWKQAIKCGKRIREIIERDEGDDWKVYFYVSPYRRTLQTLRGIGLAFERERIAGVREEPRIREQDFGNFQDREKMRVEKEVRLRYGRFFYRFPNGESAADVYDRITGFRETLRADVDIGRFQRPDSRSKNINLVMVSHGLTLRVFLMRWYKWTVQQFEGLWNFGNTGMMVMELGPGGRYSLTMHHSVADLKAFGMTDDMIADQEWQKYAKPGELNYDWLTSGSSFFSHFDDLDSGSMCDEIPPDIMGSVLGESELNSEPPSVE